ncbi:helix-turn-helix transcriptional regulator [Inquilinus sp.]|uniref:AraC family transcriptional regulator n=1 Tax=Inquilinus sp. TaxID=1932117 RepID=UPI0031E336F1
MLTHEDCQVTPRPLAAFPSDHEAGIVLPAHSHRRAQLIHAISGVMTVHAAPGSWVVPTGRAVWMPGGIEHEIRTASPIRMRTVFVEPDARPDLPRDCRVLQVSPLLRELVIAAMDLPLAYELGGRDQRIMELILDELRLATVLDLHVPIPRHPRLAALCGRFVADPSRPAEMEGWARSLAMSSRTMARLFRRETGMSFGDWCRRARVLLSLPRLAEGRSILEVALEHGYDSPSAFAAMFRRELGVPPSAYSPRGERGPG